MKALHSSKHGNFTGFLWSMINELKKINKGNCNPVTTRFFIGECHGKLCCNVCFRISNDQGTQMRLIIFHRYCYVKQQLCEESLTKRMNEEL